MRAADFLTMMEQDIQTHADKDTLQGVVELMRELLDGQPDTEIDHGKTPDGAFKSMYDYANQHKRGNSYYMTPAKAKEIIAKYLGIDSPIRQAPKLGSISLEDFI